MRYVPLLRYERRESGAVVTKPIEVNPAAVTWAEDATDWSAGGAAMVTRLHFSETAAVDVIGDCPSITALLAHGSNINRG